MPPAAPSLPVFEEWQRMSEREQDALLDRLDAHKRQGRIAVRLLSGFGMAAATAVVVAALVLLSVG
jgi:hypothetical protein